MIDKLTRVSLWLGDERDFLRESLDRHVESKPAPSVVREYDLRHTLTLDKPLDLAQRGWASVTDSRWMTIGGGSSRIQRNMIAKALRGQTE